MKITKDTGSYNDRRYGKPYIAKIVWDTPQGTAQWGEWVGQPGQPGLLVLDVEPGDTVMLGQKDHRNSRKSAPDYYVVADDGALHPVTKAEAYKLSLQEASV